ncbi:DUF1572 family protein [Marinoscillum sp.]|uniref:DUF1572 family protein n=1 Tax=Marinoscillum sp. TaxID=2024838 RepID=UPI003BAC46FE
MNQFLPQTIKLFKYYKLLGERTFEQLNEDQLTWTPSEDSNSIAILVNHLAGNMLSRWTNFLTEDGEKPWRNRDHEFEDEIHSKEELDKRWDLGWNCLLATLESLSEEDLNKTIYIRQEGQSVTDAIQRQLAHYASHIGQIILLGKIQKGPNWQSLSIPKGQSDAYNLKKSKTENQSGHFTENL